MARRKLSRRSRSLPTIGWREWLALPAFGVARIKAKVDTGARSSALHAFDMTTFERGGREWISFSIHPNQRDDRHSLRTEAPVHDHREVRPSTGTARLRPVVFASATLGSATWPIEITLVRRDMMGFRMLLGRQAVRSRFVVDPGRSYLSGFPRVDRRMQISPSTSERR
ncbi:MAG: RimK/LysX family protein [Thermoanaerobaculia bacterium]|nr:RimK/LysX family protein [Thermoanaerobaculia bacterium]